MIVNSKILHIPPHISTSWNFVRTLYLKESTLIICLAAGVDVEVPNQTPETLEMIFTAHSNFLENQHQFPPGESLEKQSAPFQMTLVKRNPLLSEMKRFSEAESDPSLGFGQATFDSLGSALHHNALHANMPDLPKEILMKISAIAKIVAPDDYQGLPKPEPHCNCTHCQIARAVQSGLDGDKEIQSAAIQNEAEEMVSEADLNFQQWEIHQTDEKLYTCSNRLDSQEKYSVYLGDPVGCTCGKQGCEHILAVLKS